jgi:hypothetical protein
MDKCFGRDGKEEENNNSPSGFRANINMENHKEFPDSKRDHPWLNLIVGFEFPEIR